MSESHYATSELLWQLRTGERSSEEVTNSCLQQIANTDDTVQAFLNVQSESALEAARAIDVRRANGDDVGILAGLPVALKDNVCLKDVPTTCASRMLETFKPPYDAHVVERLRDADAVIIGKANLDEFAMGSSKENSAFQVTRNPVNTDHSPGGSSGGSAAAVAARMAPLAIGSDTGGSIRQPAAFCGVVGMKPTYGRVSRYGLVAFASSLDQIGPMSTDVTGAAALLEAIAGHDARDSTSVDVAVPAYSESVQEPLAGLKIGVAAEHLVEGLSESVRSAFEASLDVYRKLGAEMVDISLPHSKYCIACYYLIASSEASSNLARYDGIHYGTRAKEYDDLTDLYARSRSEGFGNEVKRRIMLGTYSLSEGYNDKFYAKALKVRRLIREDYDKAFGSVDVVASPVTPTTAFKIGELIEDPLAMYLNDIYTISANLAGLPAISVPGGADSGGLPIGFQLTAPAFEESRLLRAARMLERETEGKRSP